MAESLRSDRSMLYAAGASEERWYACYTRARHEKQVARLLTGSGLDTFLPLVPRVSRWKDRRKVVEWPLFPSYVFSRFNQADSYRVLGTPGVAAIVKVDGRPAAIPDAELENVRRLAAALQHGGIEAEPREFLAEGQWVEITSGPLKGVQGIVVEHRNRRRVLIGLRPIGQGLEVDIETASLRPVPEPS